MSDETVSQPQIKITWFIAIAVALVLFSAIGGYSAHMTQVTTDYDQDRAADRYQTLAKLQADESKQLNPVDANGKPTAIWVDQDKGIIQIPIAEAMAKEVDDLKAEQCGPGCEITPAAPAPAPAAASTNAAPTTSAIVNQPVFNTHKVKTKTSVIYGGVPIEPSPTNAAPAAVTAKPNP